MIKKLRASSMDALWGCPPSVLADGPGVIRIAPNIPAAAIGKACHEMCASHVINGEYDLVAAAGHYGLGDDAATEAGKLMFYARTAWDEMSKYFPKPQVEAHVEGPTITTGDGREFQVDGTIDLCSPTSSDQAIFLDWKSGWIDDGFYQQMMAYAYLLWSFMDRPADVSITGIVVFLRHRYYRVLKYTGPQLSEWENDLVRNVLGKPNSYTPGKNCRFCELFTVCKARQAVVTGSIADIIGVDAEKPGDPGWLERGKKALSRLNVNNKDEPVAGEILEDMMFRIRLCQRAIDSAKEFIRETVHRVGPIPTGTDGTAIGLRQVDIQQLDTLRSMRVLRNRFSDNDICEALKISMPKLMGMVGKKDKKLRSIVKEELSAAGAITLKAQFRLEQIILEELEGKETEDVNDRTVTGEVE